MYMSNLHLLRKQMAEKPNERAIFSFSINTYKFRCIFIVDVIPNMLLVTSIGKDPFKFETEVTMNDTLIARIDDTDIYNLLIEYLELRGNGFTPFRPSTFFEELNRALPNVNISNRASYADVLSFSSSIYEPDKIYFWHWLPHNDTEKNHVSPYIHMKTSRAFGEEFAEKMRNLNISSCWTKDPLLEDINEIEHYIKLPQY